jgi:type I restriction enzyme S subunit
MEKVKLTDICRPKQWKTISGDEISSEGKYPVYGANGKMGFFHEYNHIDETLLIGCRGTCGTLHITEKFSYTNGNAMALDNLDKKANIKFLYYFFSKRGFNDVVSGGVQKQITIQNLQRIEIPLPNLATQQRIAAILDQADAIIQNNRAIVQKYDALTQSLFLDMFGDPVKNEKGWETKTIEQLVSKNKNSIKRGPFGGALKKEIFVEEGYLVYEQYHALNNDFSMERYFIDDKKFEELKGFEVKPKDIIISCSGVYLGKLAIVPKNAKKGIINQALLKVTIDESIMTNDFFVFHFSHKNFREKYFDANRGAGIPNFPPMSEFKKFPFIAPPIELQNQFAERVAMIEAQKQQAQLELAKSEELFQSLLQRAFKGELN